MPQVDLYVTIVLLFILAFNQIIVCMVTVNEIHLCERLTDDHSVGFLKAEKHMYFSPETKVGS